jgi:hypothetical protein
MVSSAGHDSKQEDEDMKRLSTALLAIGLIGLSGCGGRPANNTAANIASNDVYDVSPDDLGAGNVLGNEGSGNGSESNASAAANGPANASGNAH